MADAPTTTPEAVLATAERMPAGGLVEGKAGNISGRLASGHVDVTPSSVAPDTMTTCGPTPEKARHNAALAERTAKIVWGARAMGATLHPLPDKVVADKAGVYRWLRENP